MSILGNVFKAVKRVALPVLANTILPGAGPVVAGAMSARSPARAPAMGFAPQTLPTLARTAGPTLMRAGFTDWLPDVGVPGPGVFSQTKPPAGYHLSKRPPYKFVKNRRMNPANPKAARRAIRRIKATRKLLQDIERQLPKQKTRTRTVRHVPTRYSHRSD